MSGHADSYDALAELLEYPTPGLCAAAEACAHQIEPRSVAVARAVRDFAAWVAGASGTEIEELYTRTFEVQAVCCMEIGWHIFGENYHRGELLVRLRIAGRMHHLPPSTELPDHLTVVLRLVGRLEDGEDPRGLVEEAMLPAIEKMLDGFSDKGGAAHPYRGLLAAVADLLAADFALDRAPSGRRPGPLYHLPVIDGAGGPQP